MESSTSTTVGGTGGSYARGEIVTRDDLFGPIVLRPHLAIGLDLLLQAFDYARDVGRDAWDFAVEYEALRRSGLNCSDLRWLICKELVEHGQEITRPCDLRRAFQRTDNLRFRRRMCFALTERGAEIVRRGSAPPQVEEAFEFRRPRNGLGRSHNTPCWDRDRQELRVAGVVVKQFKVPAANQETILAAFEEEGWPPRIDDPLPPHPEQDPKRRLHDTINSLNRNQKQFLLRFFGDGSGQGVRWERVAQSLVADVP